MRKANESRKEIDRLLKKSKIKEANNLDNTKEIKTVCSLMVKNGPTAEEMEVYKDRIRNIVLSLMTEPVSDIPKGQIIQLIKLEKQELDNFKSIYFEYKAGMLTINDLKEQHTKVNAVMQYLDEILMSFVHNDDCKEIPEIERIINNTIQVNIEDDLDKIHEALEYMIMYFDSLFLYMCQITETYESALINTIMFHMGVGNLYTGQIIDMIGKKKETQQE